MTPIQRSEMEQAATMIQPLRNALDALPDQQSTDPLVRQCLDAGRSLAAWVDNLSREVPMKNGTQVLSAPIARDTLLHVATVGNYATGAANKLLTKAEDSQKGQYKWVKDLAEYMQGKIVALAWDYQGGAQ